MELNVTKIVIQYITPVPELLYLPTHVLPAYSVCARLHPRCSSCTATACHTFCCPELLQHLRTGIPQGGLPVVLISYYAAGPLKLLCTLQPIGRWWETGAGVFYCSFAFPVL